MSQTIPQRGRRQAEVVFGAYDVALSLAKQAYTS